MSTARALTCPRKESRTIFIPRSANPDSPPLALPKRWHRAACPLSGKEPMVAGPKLLDAADSPTREKINDNVAPFGLPGRIQPFEARRSRLTAPDICALREALALDLLQDFVQQEEARGVELTSGSDLESGHWP